MDDRAPAPREPQAIVCEEIPVTSGLITSSNTEGRDLKHVVFSIGAVLSLATGGTTLGSRRATGPQSRSCRRKAGRGALQPQVDAGRKLGDHEGAAAAFKRVAKLSPKNSPLRDSVILKEHVGP